jgi:hypothetical protein
VYRTHLSLSLGANGILTPLLLPLRRLRALSRLAVARRGARALRVAARIVLDLAHASLGVRGGFRDGARGGGGGGVGFRLLQLALAPHHGVLAHARGEDDRVRRLGSLPPLVLRRLQRGEDDRVVGPLLSARGVALRGRAQILGRGDGAAVEPAERRARHLLHRRRRGRQRQRPRDGFLSAVFVVAARQTRGDPRGRAGFPPLRLLVEVQVLVRVHADADARDVAGDAPPSHDVAL